MEKRIPKNGFLDINDSELFAPYNESTIIENSQSDIRLRSIFGFFKAKFYFIDKDKRRIVNLKLNAPLMEKELNIFCERLDIACGEFFEEFVIKQEPVLSDDMGADRWLSLRVGEPDNNVIRRIGTIRKFNSSHFGKTLIKTNSPVRVNSSGDTTKDFKTQLADKIERIFIELYGKNTYSFKEFKIIETKTVNLSPTQLNELKKEHKGLNIQSQELIFICNTSDQRVIDNINEDKNFHLLFFDKKYAKNIYQKLTAYDIFELKNKI